MEEEIKIYGKLVSVTTDGILADSSQIKDSKTGKTLDSITNEFSEKTENSSNHEINKNNPHEVTAAQVGLSNVDNTSDLDKPISNDVQIALDNISLEVSENAEVSAQTFTDIENRLNDLNKTKINLSIKGQASGVAELDESGKVPSSQLPSYVDDVVECYATYSKDNTGKLSNIKLFKTKTSKPSGQEGFNYSDEITGESGKIYVDLDADYQFRWSGTIFITVGTPTILGEITGTAYDGKKGADTTTKVNSHTTNTNNPHNVTKSQIGLSNVDNTSDQDKPISKAVQSELDSIFDILYRQNSKVSLWSNIYTIEKGTNIKVTLGWKYTFNDKEESPKTMKFYAGSELKVEDPNVKTYTETINTSKSYRVDASNHNIDKSSSLTINAYYPKFYGSSNKTELTSSDITAMNKQPIKSNAAGEYSFNVTANSYAWFCIPSSMSITKVTSGGFDVPIEPVKLVPVDGKGNYNCYRSSELFKEGIFNCIIS